MAKKELTHINRIRGNTQTCDNYTGVDGEFIINRDTQSIRIHDNKKKGGYGTIDAMHYPDALPEQVPTDLRTGAHVTVGNGRLDGGQNTTATSLAGDGLKAEGDKLVVDAEAARENIKLMFPDSNGFKQLPDGSIEVDFSQMDVATINGLRKEMGVKIPLTENKNFYVNVNTGSDVLDEGRGESADKPFKTIQACAHYVADLFDFRTADIVINVASGTYDDGMIQLGSYTTTTGRCFIKSQDSLNKATLIVHADGNIARVFDVSGSDWIITDFDITVSSEHSAIPSINAYMDVVCVYNSGAACTVSNLNISLTSSATVTSGRLRFRPFTAFSGGVLTIGDGNIVTVDDSVRERIYLFWAEQEGSLVFNDRKSPILQQTFVFNSTKLYYGLNAYNKASVLKFVSGGRNFSIEASESLASGTRYNVYSGSSASVGLPDFFPGVNEGTVEAETFSWYK